MRFVFGFLGLLIALAIVAMVVRTQLHAVRALPATPGVNVDVSVGAGAVPGSSTGDASGLNAAQQSQALQKKFADDVNRLMQQPPARAEGQ